MSKKKLVIKGSKKQKILLAIEVLIIIFMLAFAVIGKHVAKIDDEIILRVNYVCVFLTIVLSFIISAEAAKKEENDNKKKK